MEVIIVGGYGKVFISVLYGYEVVEVASLGFFYFNFFVGDSCGGDGGCDFCGYFTVVLEVGSWWVLR